MWNIYVKIEGIVILCVKYIFFWVSSIYKMDIIGNGGVCNFETYGGIFFIIIQISKA